MKLQPAKTKLCLNTYPNTDQGGFTLLEVLVVITIIGILVGVTVISFGAADQRRLTAEASRLKLAFNQAADAAMMKQITLGWFYQEEQKQYRFEQLNEAGLWLKPEGTVFQNYAIDGPIELTIEEPIQLRKETKVLLRELEKKEKPLLLFFSSGEYTPFDILLSDTKRNPVQIKGDGFGQIYSALTKP